MTSLFDEISDYNRPLAARVRPRSLDEFFGQEHLIGPRQSHEKSANVS